ncbi:MAG: DUF4430 domain-containing protein [Ruminococcaceae bacterium]|nr:DUF4430 domain-containing protein [Oscillospiraceae bacterium]
MKKKIIAICAIVLTIALMAGVYLIFGQKLQKGVKQITVEVVYQDGSEEYKIKTKAETLETAMKEADGLKFETKDGMVMVINGVRADYNLDGAYWAIYVNDGYGNYGISEQPVTDGDCFRFEYTKA